MSLQPAFQESDAFRFRGTVRSAPDRQIGLPEIVTARPSVRPATQSRLVCLSPLDWTLFATALEEAFPEAVYSRSPTLAELTSATPPKLRLEHSLRCPDLQGPTQMHFSPDTELILKRQMGWQVASEGLFWPQMTVGRATAALPQDEQGPERLRVGQMLLHLAPHHHGHARFARQIWKLLAQFTTNQRQILVRYPDYEALPAQALSRLWIGHDALCWAREDSKRLLAYERSPLARRRPETLGYGYWPVE